MSATRPVRVARRGIVLVAAAVLGACASLPPPPPETFYFDEEALPSYSPPSPMIEYPPIEPVEPPPEVVTTAAPAAVPAPAPVAPPLAKETTPPAVPERVVVATAAPTLPPPLAIPVEDLQTLALLADLNRYGALSPDELRRELNAASNALTRERSDINRVRLAVLYTLTRAGPPDDQRALQLLENVAKSPGGPTPTKQLAALLQMQVAERLRAVRDEQVKANEAVQKLEALRAMERSLLRDRVRSGGGAGGGGGGSSGGGGGGGGGQ